MEEEEEEWVVDQQLQVLVENALEPGKVYKAIVFFTYFAITLKIQLISLNNFKHSQIN